MQPAIKSLSIRMLHHYLDIDLEFSEGLNVIYGKNGKGKTTVLHIIANILELDFSRFSHIKFHSISVASFSGDILDLAQDDDGLISASLNKKVIGLSNEVKYPILSVTEEEIIKRAFGGRPVYLPAYRSILEKVKSTSSQYEAGRSSDHEAIKRKELLEITKENPSFVRHRDEQRANMVAFKTLQCRDWFGPFVPIIRYPGLADVVDSISEEFNEAQMSSSQAQSQMLNSIFIGVFNSITSKDETPGDGEVEPLLERVKTALDDTQTNASLHSITASQQLAHAVRQAKFAGDQDNDATKRVLKLYADMLERLKDENQRVFKKLRSFESAVNKFLDGKLLEISPHFARNHNRWREYAFVRTNNNSIYPLATLSSGERQILTMLFTASRMSTASTGIFLIDEPELSLHIDWQRIILANLEQQAANRQIIACTHSPEVGADHPDAIQIFSPTVNNSHDPSEDDESYLEDLS
ncbi:AAA family ATPase [Pseudomonas sp. 39167]|uniref:AAA family ATPase n=1 Tax=Pseudomonas sp. 39167 TaxID=2967215 RepID=UPI002364053E|nr:AAA family ATPase [Pseudomonas sp. 39167]MDD2032121.1 ATP-binding protein [Pseudomonas sp. 39167]